MLPSCLTPCKYKYRERRSHFLALSKDNHAQSGVPSQIRGRPGVTGGQPVLCRIVAVGWPGPVAVLVLFARSSKEKVTAHPPPGSPDYARGRRCLSAERRISPFINRDIFSSFPSGKNEKIKKFDSGVRTKSWTKQRPQGGNRYIVHIRKESPRPAII